ncbi:hypothetical protein MMC25_002680 [Agyrium rufum]|nr:hypothetical protein [Agyrium rufum]
MSSTWGLLDQVDEDALHKARLLNVEEKSIKRITKRLLPLTSPQTALTASKTRLQPSSDTRSPSEAPSREEAASTANLAANRELHDNIILDFAAFDASIARMQFTRTANASERARYSAEKSRILSLSQTVRSNTAQLRTQLENAQRQLALKKTYDDLAEKITSNRLLRTREEQGKNLERLEKEIAELERESRVYRDTWVERRSQFGRIVEEGLRLRGLIRDEKEEVERREGMQEEEKEGEDGEEGHGLADVAEKSSISVGGAKSGSAVGTLGPENGGATPLDPGLGTETVSTGGSTSTGRLGIETFSKPAGGRSPLRGADMAIPVEEMVKPDSNEDVDMAEDGEVSADGEGDAEAVSSEGLAAPLNGENRSRSQEREAEGEHGDGDRMDTS